MPLLSKLDIPEDREMREFRNMVFGPGTKAVRMVFNKHCELELELQRNRQNIERRLNPIEQKKVFQGDVTSEDFDILVMDKVMKSVVADINTATSHHLARIRSSRNIACHEPKFSNHETFEKGWKDLIESIKQLSGDSLQTEIENIEYPFFSFNQKLRWHVKGIWRILKDKTMNPGHIRYLVIVIVLFFVALFSQSYFVIRNPIDLSGISEDWLKSFTAWTNCTSGSQTHDKDKRLHKSVCLCYI